MAKNDKAAQSQALTTNPGGTKTYALQLNTSPMPEGFLAGFKRQGLTQIVKPREMAVGAWFVGIITGIIPSPIAEYKNRVMVVNPVNAETGEPLSTEQGGGEFGFPLTAVIGNALGKGKDQAESDKIQDQKIGWTIMVRKTGEKPARSGKKKPTGLYDVYLKEPDTTGKKGK